ncbi:MAG: gliding motility-associated ABC transporter substrate-binding protein GldG [Mucilaginibacter polytrichastri]|nr:gliding motility-associated ABC transporter substrate-binding protein GldG [Mucilaginibacter polytrichastri]
MFSILKKELITFFSALAAWISIGIFLLVLGLLLWLFPDTSILDYGYATLDSFFSIVPYLFLFLIPALTMRSIAEERREGTFELLVTQPLRLIDIVLGKFLAGLVLVVIALLPTLVYYLSVYQLGAEPGNLDTGAVIGSYFGLFFLGGCMVSLGILASALSRNQIVAFVIAVFLSFIAYSGFDALSQIISMQNLGLEKIGFSAHYQAMGRGVLDSRDLAYFLGFTALFLGLSVCILAASLQKLQQQRAFFTLVFPALLVLVLVLNFAHFRIDFTAEKRYTLSDYTRKTLGKIPGEIGITVFLQGDFPSGFKNLQQATRDLLGDMQSYAGAGFAVEFVDPLAGRNTQEQDTVLSSLASRGIEPTNLGVKTESGVSQKLIFPFALIRYKDRESTVRLLQTRAGSTPEEVLNNSAQNLEYAFTSALQKISSGDRPRIGITEGHGELNDVQLNDATRSLGDGFFVGRVNLASIPFRTLSSLKLLIVAKPQSAFSEAEKFKLDQYIMQGGKVIWSVDQVSADLDSLRGRGDQLAFAKQLNLDDQLFRYGVRLNYDLIADMNCARIPVNVGNVGGAAQMQLLPWLFYPIFMPTSVHPVVKNLEGIRSEFPGTIEALRVPGIRSTVLLHSSPFSRRYDAPKMLSLQMLEMEPDPQQFRGKPMPTGVLLEGSFPSDFRNRPVPEAIKETIRFIEKSKPTQQAFFSDGDLFKNQVSTEGSPFPLGFDRFTQQNFGNKALLLNLVDYFTSDADLIRLRAKEYRLRLLDRAKIRGEKGFWQALNIGLPPLLLIIAAIFQQWMRKRRNAGIGEGQTGG